MSEIPSSQYPTPPEAQGPKQQEQRKGLFFVQGAGGLPQVSPNEEKIRCLESFAAFLFQEGNVKSLSIAVSSGQFYVCVRDENNRLIEVPGKDFPPALQEKVAKTFLYLIGNPQQPSPPSFSQEDWIKRPEEEQTSPATPPANASTQDAGTGGVPPPPSNAAALGSASTERGLTRRLGSAVVSSLYGVGTAAVLAKRGVVGGFNFGYNSAVLAKRVVVGGFNFGCASIQRIEKIRKAYWQLVYGAAILYCLANAYL